MNLELPRSGPPRIMIYSQDGFGLGHMRRTHSLASRFLAVRPEACILTLCDSRLGHVFETLPNHDYLKLPSIMKVGPGDWRAVKLPGSFEDVYSIRQELIRTAALSFAPDVFLVDHMPHGAVGELLPTLEALKSAGRPTKIVLGLRDILDAPEVVHWRWQSEGAYDAMEQYYDRVLIYGMREVFDAAEQYRFPPTVVERLRYCGYVLAPVAVLRAAEIRAKYLKGSNSETRLIVAMAGGGADAYPMMRTMLEALPLVQAHRRIVLVLIAGPFMPADLYADLKVRAEPLPARPKRLFDDTLDLMAAADLVVAMAGYNTTIELLRWAKRAILIPRAGPSAEQRMRAQLFTERHWVEAIEPGELSPNVLAQTVLDGLAAGPRKSLREEPNLGGLDVAVDQLLALLPKAAHPAAVRLANSALISPSVSPSGALAWVNRAD